MEVGYIKLYRQILDNPTVMKNGDYLAIWVYLLLKATHNGVNIIFNNQRYKLNPGEFSTGRKIISNDLSIDENKVERVLKKFESEGQIEQVTDHKCRIIKIIKWDEFQKVNKGGTSDEQVVNTKQEGKNERKYNNEIYNFYLESKDISITKRTVTQHLLVCFYDLGYKPSKDETIDSLREWITDIAKLKSKTPQEMIGIITSWHTYWKGEKKPVKNHKSSLLNNYALKNENK